MCKDYGMWQFVLWDAIVCLFLCAPGGACCTPDFVCLLKLWIFIATPCRVHHEQGRAGFISIVIQPYRVRHHQGHPAGVIVKRAYKDTDSQQWILVQIVVFFHLADGNRNLSCNGMLLKKSRTSMPFSAIELGPWIRNTPAWEIHLEIRERHSVLDLCTGWSQSGTESVGNRWKGICIKSNAMCHRLLIVFPWAVADAGRGQMSGESATSVRLKV